MGIVIDTSQLTRRFGDLTAVDGITFQVAHGEVFGFLGHNGAGKTTTIRLLNGVLEPSAGTATVLGYDPVAQGVELRQRTGVLTENPSLDERLSAHENLYFYADLYGVPKGQIKARAEELLEMFELADRADERVGGYSKGMKQRLALARALLHNPEILYLDEPTAGLDPVATRRVHELITHLSAEEGHTVFLCTHNLAEAQKLCDRVAVLEHGKVLALGTPAELAARLGQRLGLELEIDPTQQGLAIETLKKVDGLEIGAAGDVVTVAGALRPVVPEMIKALVEAGVRLYRVTPQEPSLEDVYFALHGE